MKKKCNKKSVNKSSLCPIGVSLSLHGCEPQRRSPHRRRVRLRPSASGFPSCEKADIMEESSVEALDSSTQDDVPPLGETQHHSFLYSYM